MGSPQDDNTMSERELTRNIHQMAQSITVMSESVTKLVESDIRRQERETRQEEFNNMMRDRVHSLEDWRQDLEIKRASESQPREALNKYWWVLVLLGGWITFQVGKTGGFSFITG